MTVLQRELKEWAMKLGMLLTVVTIINIAAVWMKAPLSLIDKVQASEIEIRYLKAKDTDIQDQLKCLNAKMDRLLEFHMKLAQS